MKTHIKFVAILSLFLFGCGGGNVTESVTKPKKAIDYEIVNEDNRDPIINVDVFIKDTVNLRELNEQLKEKYNPSKNKFLDLNYYDNEHVAKIFKKVIMDPNTSDKVGDSLVKHRLAIYKINPSTGYEKFEVEEHK
jgi:hypothetical protein